MSTECIIKGAISWGIYNQANVYGCPVTIFNNDGSSYRADYNVAYGAQYIVSFINENCDFATATVDGNYVKLTPKQDGYFSIYGPGQYTGYTATFGQPVLVQVGETIIDAMSAAVLYCGVSVPNQ